MGNYSNFSATALQCESNGCENNKHYNCKKYTVSRYNVAQLGCGYCKLHCNHVDSNTNKKIFIRTCTSAVKKIHHSQFPTLHDYANKYNPFRYLHEKLKSDIDIDVFGDERVEIPTSNRSISLPELLLYGYIRTHSNNLEIPEVLIHLCGWFFGEIIDVWDCENSHADFNTIEDDKYRLRAKESCLWDRNWKNAFGSLIIKQGTVQTWKLKFINKGSMMLVIIGIIESNKRSPNIISYFCNGDNDSYALNAFDGDKYIHQLKHKYTKRCEYNDVIEMTLDMRGINENTNGVLSFKVNGEDKGIATDNIDIQKQYSMACAVYYDDIIELLTQ